MSPENRIPLDSDIPTLLANVQRTLGVPPKEILDLGYVFEAADKEIALIGGPVRDAFLDVTPSDFDLTTSVKPERTKEPLIQWGVAVWDIDKEFGTIGGRKKGLVVEVTTCRSDPHEVGSHRPEVTFESTLEGNLVRRDFTVSAMAICLPGMVPVDPHHSFEDLAKARLRTPVTAEQSFDDGPSRIMGVTRFAAQLGVDVDLDVMEAVEVMTPRLQIVSAEWVRTELGRLIVPPYPRRGLKLMVRTGVYQVVLPELSGLVSTVDEHKRHKDVYKHILTVLEQATDLETDGDGPVPTSDFILHFAAIVHDVGKPMTRRFEPNEVVSSHHHEIVGTKLARKRMKALKFDRATTEAVSTLVTPHLCLHGYGGSAWTDSVMRHHAADADGLLERLHHLIRADCTTHNRRRTNTLSTAYGDLKSRIATLREQEELDAVRPDLNDQGVMEILGFRPSHTVKMVLELPMSMHMEKRPTGKEAAREALPEWRSLKEAREIAREYKKQQTHWEAMAAQKRQKKAAVKAKRVTRAPGHMGNGAQD